MRKLILLSLLVSTSAFAQSAPVQPQTEYVIKLTAQELDVVGRGLGELPFKDVAYLIQKMRSQVVEQQKPKVTHDDKPIASPGTEDPPK